ncbi:IS701 family transposase [Streptomyces sp. NPDC002039]|uniref:IS701 family transposase n=1 Tax=Streptomyces sp. NPDC002039 TaxID=3154660 RepID=UPI003320EB3D
MLGLLSDLPRKNCWTIAEWAGERTPDGMQHLLGRAERDADRVRDDVCDYVLDHLHDDQAVLVVDETGDVKKGTDTVGVQRWYTGTAGRIENAQVAVYLVYAGRRGHAAVDRELYVPRSWTSDPDRCRDAGLDQDTAFATKPELATRMVARFLDAGHQAAWVAGDEVYGGNLKLRTALEERGTGHLLAVACTHEVATGAGRFRADTLSRTRRRAHPPRTRCPHSAHLQRDPAPVHDTRCPTRPRCPPTGSVGPTGGAATRHDPGPATTVDKPLGHQIHDLRLECQARLGARSRRRPGPRTAWCRPGRGVRAR